MKRAHDDISPAEANGDLPSNASEPVVAENGGAKSEGQGSAAAAAAGQSSAAAAAPAAAAVAEAAATTAAAVAGAAATAQQRKKCPYLDTINRNVLDFDFEKLCSISLSNNNVYACLVCGKYFQGRGRNTHAYTHSVQNGHHVFINLRTCRVYCLPDSYEVVDSSLEDIKRALDPRYSPEGIAALDKNTTLSRDQYGVAYLPGFVGLNNLKCTDFVNVVLHALAHVPPLRNFFVEPDNYKDSKSTLVHAFGEVVRRIWSPSNFKSAVSPHEFIQAVSYASKKRFRPGVQSEAIDFLAWLLNSLHQGLGGTRKAGSSVVFQTFQGLVEVETLTKKKATILDDDDEEGGGRAGNAPGKAGAAAAEDELVGFDEADWDKKKAEVPFLHLTLDIPATPLFKDSQGGNIIPQIPLFKVLDKYNGENWTDVVKGGVLTRKRYVLRRLPRYLIFHLARFTKNNFYVEKNPTIVNFPVKNLELKDWLRAEDPGLPKEEDLAGMSIKQLKAHLNKYSISSKECVERRDLEEKVRDTLIKTVPELLATKYNLLANVCHDSPPGQGKEGQTDPLSAGCYRAHVQNKATEQWYEVQDLHVQETMPQLIGLSESYIIIYERKRGL
ncbi:unnamed protein product [Ectocarpus sp. 12 AP-2014]